MKLNLNSVKLNCINKCNIDFSATSCEQYHIYIYIYIYIIYIYIYIYI